MCVRDGAAAGGTSSAAAAAVAGGGGKKRKRQPTKDAAAGGLQGMGEAEKDQVAATFTRGLVDLQFLGAPTARPRRRPVRSPPSFAIWARHAFVCWA